MAYRMTKLSEFAIGNFKSTQTVFKNDSTDVFVESGSNLVKISYENGNLEKKYDVANFFGNSLQLIVPTWNVQHLKGKTLIFLHKETGLEIYQDEFTRASKKTADGSISKKSLAVDTITDVHPVILYGKFGEQQFIAIARSRLKSVAMQTVKFDDPSKVDAKNGTGSIEGGNILEATRVGGFLKHFVHRAGEKIELYKIDADKFKIEKIETFRLDPQHEPTMERAFITEDNLYYFNDAGLNIFDLKTTRGITCDEFSKLKGWKQENMKSLTQASPTRFFFTGSLGIRYFDFEDKKCNVKLIANMIWQTHVKHMQMISVFLKDDNLKMLGVFENKLQYVEWKEFKPKTRRRRSLPDPDAVNGANRLGNIFSQIIHYFGRLFSRLEKSYGYEDNSLEFLKDNQPTIDANTFIISQDFHPRMEFLESMAENHRSENFAVVDQNFTFSTKNAITSFENVNGWILLAMVAPAIVSQAKSAIKSLIGVIRGKGVK